jgi:phasin family protein
MNISAKLLDSKAMFSSYCEMLAPMLQVQQEGVKAFERFARHQMAVVNDCLESSLAQAKLSLATTAPAELMALQKELGTKLGDQLRSRHLELTTIASETQLALIQAVTECAGKVSASFKKAV